MTTSPSPRLTVALTFDHDAISSEVRRGDGPMTISRGEFGPRVGARRVLELLDREGIPSTWFVPGHTIETFPESVAAVVAAGHELACHGWLHEDLSTLTPDGERAVLVRSVENTHWHQPLYLIFDSETMPQWFGMPDDRDLPSTFSVEYVRAWKRQDERR